MGERGPKPLPANVHLLRGNPSKKPIAELLGEFRPPVGMPKRPAELNDAARKIWKRIGAELESLGLISKIDESAFAAYCLDYAEYLAMQAKIDALSAEDPARPLHGYVQTAESGYQAKSVWVTLRDAAHKRLAQSEAKFGMFAAARSRVTQGDQQMTLPLDDEKPAQGWGSI